ncbi:DMT family transporter [Paraclostridium bifermentans]|uniref:DMT family transporter n=1 Tax=Paraclostridium bifermentans TaxID=1490 RepID=UPI001FF3B360|nr:DMT family transporter [Paraclostridium bifermentans]UOW68459.1 DMT family transporter [Paraclostridium bifermentans]
MENNKNMKKGLLLGITVGLAWGLDSVLMGKVGGSSIFSSFELSPLVSAFFHDGFCFMWIALVLLFGKQLKPVFGLLKTKKGKATALAALVGAPIGMSAYLLGIKYATAPYASSISVIYPGIGAILSYFILKEKLSLRAIIGIAVSLLGSFMLGFNPSGNVPDTFFMGIAFASVAVLGWALEGVIIGFAMKHIKGEDDVQPTPQQFLCLRYLISMISYGLVVLPLIGGYGVAAEVVTSGTALAYAGIAILGATTYLCWYKAVDLIGAAMGTALNSTAALWSIVFSAIVFGDKITPSLGFWGFVIVSGVFIFAIDPKSMKKKAK